MTGLSMQQARKSQRYHFYANASPPLASLTLMFSANTSSNQRSRAYVSVANGDHRCSTKLKGVKLPSLHSSSSKPTVFVIVHRQANHITTLKMKVTPLALLTVFAASSSAFGLNSGVSSVAQATRSAVSFKKPALVQPVDVHGNRLSTSVSRRTKSKR